MARLKDAIAYATNAAMDVGEAELAARFADKFPQPTIDAQTQAQFAPFIHWCEGVSARHLPAKPITVAAYALQLSEYGGNTDNIVDAMRAIELVHDSHGLANPVATRPVRYALDLVYVIGPPRSWLADEKISFQLLPADIRAAIARREQERETRLRNAQNEIAEERKRLKAEADQSAETQKENDNGEERRMAEG